MKLEPDARIDLAGHLAVSCNAWTVDGWGGNLSHRRHWTNGKGRALCGREVYRLGVPGRCRRLRWL